MNSEIANIGMRALSSAPNMIKIPSTRTMRICQLKNLFPWSRKFLDIQKPRFTKGAKKTKSFDETKTTLATSRHTSPSLPLLPSGPGGVHNLSLREDQGGESMLTFLAAKNPPLLELRFELTAVSRLSIYFHRLSCFF